MIYLYIFYMKKFISLFIVIIIYACGSDESINDNDNFDRGLILASTYDNIIIPAYNNFNQSLVLLQENINQFINDPSQEKLENARLNWKDAYINWQSVAMFNLRKAEQIFYANLMNAYPCNEIVINNKINNSVTEIGEISINELGSTGFPALGYMLYGLEGENSSVLSNYTGDEHSNYKNYLSALINHMTLNTNLVVTDWKNNRSEFVNSTGNSSTSSLNKIINDFLQYLEKRLREAKIANPSSVRGDLNPNFNQVESFYHPEICKILLKNAFLSVERFYYGYSFDGSSIGKGLDYYLMNLENTEELRTAIDDQIIDIKNKIEDLDDNFITQLENNPQKMWDLFYSIQNLVTFTKSDMLSMFNISSDYMDNDGD